MDVGTDKSIREIIERATQERNEILQSIENLLTNKLPDTLKDSERTLKTFEELSKGINVSFNPNRDIDSLLQRMIDKLIDLKTELEGVSFAEEDIINDSSIGNARKILDLIAPAIEEIKNNFLNSNSKTLIENYKAKQELQVKQESLINEKAKLETEKAELEKEQAYLQEQANTIRGRRNKRKTEEEIDIVDDQITELSKKTSILGAQIGITKSQIEDLSYKTEENPKQVEGHEEEDSKQVEK